MAGVNGYPLYGEESPDGVRVRPGSAMRPCFPEKRRDTECMPYQNRHRWEGTRIPRRAGETSLRNSATWPRNFGRRGPSG